MESSEPFFIFTEERDTRYSIRAVLAALEHARGVRPNVYLVRGLGNALDRASSLLAKERRVVLAVSLMTTMIPRLTSLLQQARRLKQIHRERLLLLVGGAHATCDPYGSITRLGFDVAVVGEAEETVAELYDALTERWMHGIEDVKGIAARIGDSVIYTGRRSHAKLDEYPPFPYWRRLFTPIEIVRGCPWGCRYCATWFIHGSRERYRSIDAVKDYAVVMLSRGLRDLRFIAPNSLAYGEEGRGKPRLELVEELLDALAGLAERWRGRVFFGTFPSEVRPDYVTDEAMRIMRGRVANRRIIIGAQSGSERMLKLINRGHSVEDVVNAVATAKSHGFGVDVDIIFGLPGEDNDDVEATIKLIEVLTRMGARIHAHTFLPLPGTPFESAEPGSAKPYIARGLLRYLGRGLVYGYWEKQERLAAEIHRLYREGVILGLRGWRLLHQRARRGIPCEPRH